jgi:hypothetical protein
MLMGFHERNVPVYFLGTPYNRDSYRKISNRVVAHYIGYLQAYSRRYPNFHILGNPFPLVPWWFCGDFAPHLNSAGAVMWSDYVRSVLINAKLIEYASTYGGKAGRWLPLLN